MDSRQYVSIVIPAFNEEGNIKVLYERLTQALAAYPPASIEIIFVNDGSTDATLQQCQTIMQQDARVKIVDLERNFGHEIAMTAGMDYSQGEGVIFMDADCQHPPELVPKLIEKWQAGFDAVLTNRINNSGESLFYRLASACYHKLASLFSASHIPSKTPDFRLIGKKYINILKKMDEKERIFRGMLSWLGLSNYAVIEFTAPKRQSGQSKYNFKSLFNLGINGIVQFSTVPLRIATYIGLFAAALSLLLGAYTLWEYFTGNTARTGYATIILTIIFIGAVQLIVLGIIGEYIGRIHMEVKKRPLYVADYLTQANTEPAPSHARSESIHCHRG